MNSRGVTLLLGLLVYLRASLVAAHEFWLEPSAYRVEPDALTSLTLEVGLGASRQRSPIPARRIVRFQAIGPDGAVADLRGKLRLDRGAEDADFRLAQAGVSILVLQTDNHAQSHVPAARFNDYLEDEGLTPALERRTRLHLMAVDGSERYFRCAKAMVQVGPPGAGSQSQVTRPVGLPLEIVPQVSPYGSADARVLPVRVLYGGRPLAGARVKLTQLEHDASPLEALVTDHAGRASFTMPHSGTWLLNVVWTKPLPATEETDFETVFSSLSFGFPAGHA